MAELQKRLEKRKREREEGKSWYENWFDTSPWITNILSTLAGPIIVIIMMLVFGPCILKYITSLVKNRFDTAKLFIL
ncbi:ENV1 protein, partial [Larus smithsonianus]|nr:ENV1 protein [Larus smithsonianus]